VFMTERAIDGAAEWGRWDECKKSWLEQPTLRARAQLVEQTLRALPEIIAGRRRALEVLFPDSSADLVSAIYSNNPLFDYFNDLLSCVVVAYLEERIRHDPSVRLRILEIGAGTGSASQAVCSKLTRYSSSIEEYCYTDLSQALLLQAQERYAATYPYLRFRTFNVELAPQQQAIQENSYDLVMAANALHATRDIRRTLRNSKALMKHDGLLVLNEITGKSVFTHLTFGLLEGWWLYEDAALRIPGCPAVRPDVWQSVLQEEGYSSVFFPAEQSHHLGLQIIAAARDSSIQASQEEMAISDFSLEHGPASTKPLPSRTVGINTGVAQSEYQAVLLNVISTLLKLREEAIDVDAGWGEFGLDSIGLTKVIQKVNQVYRLKLSPTLFFEHSTPRRLSAHLAAQKPNGLEEMTAVGSPRCEKSDAPELAQVVAAPRSHGQGLTAVQVGEIDGLRQATPKIDPIAIIGVSGRFPQARNLDEFWENLSEGRDCITEIPEERWDWRAFYGDPASEANKTNIKWGAFIDGIAEFDPMFFGISPREAELMDPTQRLLMTHSWKAIEDAGYAAQSLSGSRTAVFLGTGGCGYSTLIAQAGLPAEGYNASGTISSVGPNRISYFLNLQGPSEPIETACSSSLLAIHRGVQAIRSEQCDMALVGGVNTIVTPNAHIGLSKAGMLSEDGRCKAFSARANGYVRGEGVGILLLKKLSIAQRDGDHIYAVIRATAENHGGRASSLTAPNPLSQAALLKAAYTQARVDPRTIGYIEAHGTGTALGDPIEINALKSAFKDLYAAEGDAECDANVVGAHCGLGSVKTNVGHLELAAGVAGVIKVLLQLEHKTLVKSLHCEELNPYIELAGSPFYIVRETKPWEPIQSKDGRYLPRRAGVSSFGAGGVNLHVVIEEYIEPERIDFAQKAAGPLSATFVLSAKGGERLSEYARDLLAALNAKNFTERDLPSIAYTLQVGRDAMDHRVAFTAASITELREKLAGILDERSIEQLHRGEVKRNKDVFAAFEADEDVEGIARAWIAKGKYSKLLNLWTKGLALDWNGLYGNSRPQRISLPTYPFAREHYWVPPPRVADEAGAIVRPDKTEPEIQCSVPVTVSPSQPASRKGSETTQARPFTSAAKSLELLTFEESWIEEPLRASRLIQSQRLVCFLSQPERQKAVDQMLKKLDPQLSVIFVEQGTGYEKCSSERYSISRTNGDDYVRTLKAIRAEHGTVGGLLYMWPVEDCECRRDVTSVAYLVRALAAAHVECPRVLLAAEFDNLLDHCYLESWMGFERSLKLILPETKLALILQQVTGGSAKEEEGSAIAKASQHIQTWTRRLWN
jgi:polyketide synthase PksM